MDKIKISTESDFGKRADVFLAEMLDCTRSYLKKLFDSNLITVEGTPIKSNYIIKKSVAFLICMPEPEVVGTAPQDIPINIVYQDDDIVVINKAQGMTVHAGNGNKDKTLVNALLFHIDNLSGINGVIRPGIVHRIDKNTSGLLVVAKNDKAHVALAKQIENKTCKRVYVALLEGVLKQDCGTIETFIGRDPKCRTKMAVTKTGRTAITDFKVIKRFNNYTLCEFYLKTGRTHQIRVHAKHLNHPVVGDPEYGYKNQKFNLNGQLLHARTLEFVHPRTGEMVAFNAPIPEYFQRVLNSLK